MTNSSNVPLLHRIVAASSHLCYIGLGLVAGLLAGAPLKGLLVLALLVGLLLFGFAVARTSELVRLHGKLAMGYHKLGLVFMAALVAFVFYAAIFTWGVGAPLAVLLVPAILYWMAPTFTAANRAFHGLPYRYDTLSWFRASKANNRHRAVLTEEEAREQARAA